MGIETQEKEIDDATFRVTPHKARAGAKLSAKLARIILPVMGGLKGQTLVSIQKMEMSELAPAFGNVLMHLDDATLDALMADIYARTTVVIKNDKGEPELFDLSKGSRIDDAFTGALGLMFKGMWFAVEVNFGNFFDETGPSAGAEKAPTEAAAP